MSIEILDGSTIINFVQDDEAFSRSVRRRFAELDVDQDGFLSYEEMLAELQSLRLLDADCHEEKKSEAEVSQIYESVFKLFDHDSNGKIDFEEYKAETKKIMLQIANDLGFQPLQMVLEQDSFIKMALEREKKKRV
ncbi:hypothetical protein UlMin_013906 [Ulmus minor]